MQYGNYRKDGVEVDLGSVRGKPRLDPFYYAVGEPAPGKTLIEGVDEVGVVVPPAADHQGKTENDLLDELIVLIKAAVGRTPIEAVSLSGGLDSAIVAVVAKPKLVFSCAYDDYPELDLAIQVAETIGAKQVVVRPTESDARRSLANIVRAVGQPTFPSSAVGCWKLCEAMQEHGIHDAADGTGPDELFGGYIRYLLVAMEQAILDCPELRRYQGMLRRFWGGGVGHAARRYYNLLRSGGEADGPVWEFVLEQFAIKRAALVESMTRVDLQLGMRGFVGMTSGCAKAHGIAWHSPLLDDDRIVSFALGLPDHCKVDPRAALDGRMATKILLRRAARILGVPDRIIDRTDKQGWVTPIARWFSGPLAVWAQELRSRLATRGYALRDDPSRGEFDQSAFADVCLELWLASLQQ